MVNYITKEYLLEEIIKSKISYSTFKSDKDKHFHISVDRLDDITEKTINKLIKSGITLSDIVIRMNTYEHVPTEDPSILLLLY